MRLLEKQKIVENLAKYYNDNLYVIIVDYNGMNAKDTGDFRGELRKQDGLRFLVVKNTLNRKAAEGTEFFSNLGILKGQCGAIFCNDLLKVSKVLNNFCFKEQKIKFIACIKGGEVCDEKTIKELATLPSLDVLRTKLLYLLNSQQSSLVRLLSEVAKNGREGIPSDK